MNASCRVVYIYDTLCGWCNVARSEINKLFVSLENQVQVTVLHRRLFTDGYIPVINEEFLNKVRHVGWKVAPTMTGQQFSEQYLNLLQSPGFEHDSHLTSVACAVASILSDAKTAFHYAAHLQGLVFDHGLNPKQTDTLIQAAQSLGFAKDVFLKELSGERACNIAIEAAKEAAALQSRVGAQGVPCLLTEKDDRLIKLNPYRFSESLAEIKKIIYLL